MLRNAVFGIINNIQQSQSIHRLEIEVKIKSLVKILKLNSY